MLNIIDNNEVAKSRHIEGAQPREIYKVRNLCNFAQVSYVVFFMMQVWQQKKERTIIK